MYAREKGIAAAGGPAFFAVARGAALQRFVLHEGIQRPERGNQGAASAFQEQKPVPEGQNLVRAWLGALFYLGAALCCGPCRWGRPLTRL